jgi:S1-C subfamily serine protease
MTAPEDRRDTGLQARARQHRGAITVGLAAVLALVLVAVVFYRVGSNGRPESLPTPTATPTPARSPTTAEIYTALAPSIVSIESAHSDPAGDDTGTGTGVIVNADATILTALHVVNGASSIRVTFADGTSSAATIMAADPSMDIAILGPSTLPEIIVPAVLGGGVAVGDPVVAIGNPLGLTRTTTSGVVSGLDRVANSREGGRLSGLIQFDAAVNPGSSGGPLLNGRGEIVGIVVALANPTTAGTFIGIGFAVPIGAAIGAGEGEPGPQQ